jgi:hypothetical protein
MAGFRAYLLKERRKKTVDKLMNFTAKYGHILQTQDASELLKLSSDNRRHTMCALACLSKYLGCYNQWKGIKERYDLKWTNNRDIDIFNAIMDSKNNYSSMLAWLKESCSQLPEPHRNVLLYTTMTGLRASEAFYSIHLLHTQADNYLNKERLMIEHFKYPDFFLRRTKKAYISLATPTILEIAQKCSDKGENAFRHSVKRLHLQDRVKLCRKIFATHLRMQGITPEIIDLLQGRIPKSVFARHYLRLDIDVEFQKVRNALASLNDVII